MIDDIEPIKTERLVLRPFVESDEDDMFAFESLPEVARHLYNEPRTRAANAEELGVRMRKTALREEGDSVLLAIVLNGTVIGHTLLGWRSEQNKEGEFGYTLHPDYHGKGYASEASVEMLRLGFEHLGLHRIIGRCAERNAASARLMERFGMRKEAHFVESELVKGEWNGVLVYAMLAREWAESPWAS